jgi:hypothetical protein
MPNADQLRRQQADDYVSDLELDSDLLRIINYLVAPNDSPRLAIRAAILSALPEIGMPEEDQEIVKDWLTDVAEGRM